MEAPKTTTQSKRFFVYRYQLLARIDPQQPQFVYTTPDKIYSSVEELRSAKNEIFFDMLKRIQFKWPFGDISHQVVYEEAETELIRLAVNRPTILRTEDFKNIVTNDWPWIYIYIDNNPKSQFLVIEIDRDAWTKTEITVRMLQENFNQYLNSYYLMVEINPLIEKRAFWEFVEKYKGRIEVVEFDMVSPNMSNISENSKWPLRKIRDEYNATRQKVRLENGMGTSIDVKKDELISSMADYSAMGGGKSRFKLKGVRGYRTLSDDKVGFEIDEVYLETDDPGQFAHVAKTIQRLLKSLGAS